MSNIDFSSVITAEDIQAERMAERETQIKAACSRRILAVADQHAQINMASAAAAGRMNGTARDTYAAGVGWIEAMLDTRAHLAANQAADHTDDSAWPPVPDGFAALADLF